MGHTGAAATLAAGVLMLLAACGGSDDDSGASSAAPSPSSSSSSSSAADQTQAWADELCSATSTWKTQLSTATAQLSDTANLSVNGVKASLTSMATATSTFASDLRGLGSPGTQAGDQAKQKLSDLGDTLDAQRQQISDSLDGVTNARQLIAQLPTLQTALSTMATSAQTTAQDISGLAGSDELKQAFESSADCQAAGFA